MALALTTHEAAQYLGFPETTLTRWRRVGTGPRYVRDGRGHVRYPLMQLRAWQRRHATAAADDPPGDNIAEITCPHCGWIAAGVDPSMAIAEGRALGAWTRHMLDHVGGVQ